MSLAKLDRTSRLARWEWPALAAVTVLAAAFRLYRIGAVPPGLNLDEAVYGLQAQYIYQGHFPVFFPAYTGREPFYMYIAALVYLFTGPNTFGLRLTSALIGIATVPAAYLALKALAGRRVGMLTAMLIAISSWHIAESRVGYCWILMPLIECISIYFLWRGYRENRLLFLAIGGAAAGSMLYIYLAARFFPVSLLLILGFLALVDRPRLRSRGKGLILAAAVAVLVFAPLGIHYVRVPHDFWERADQVLAWKQAGNTSVLSIFARNAYRMVIAFLPRRQLQSSYNVEGRPLVDLVLGPFFLLGLALVVLRARRRPQYGLLALWWLGMALPPVFTIEPYPVGQRIFGCLPALCGLVALGMALVWRRFESWRPEGKVTPAVLVLLVGVEGLLGGMEYWGHYVGSRAAYEGLHGDMTDIGRLIRPELAAGHRIIIASNFYHHPSTIFTEPAASTAKWVQGSHVAALPAWDGREIDYFVPIANARLIAPVLQVLQNAACTRQDFPGPDGAPGVSLYRICQPPLSLQPTPPLATFSDEVALESVQVPANAGRDAPLFIGIHWQVLRPVQGSRFFSVHLVDAQGVRWAQADENGYLTPEWHAGDQVWQWLEVPTGKELPPGTYQVQLIMADENAAALPVLNPQGGLMGLYIQAGQVTIGGDPRWIEPAHSQAPQLGPLSVREWTPVGGNYQPGESLLADVTWQLTGQVTDPLDATLELHSADGKVAAQWRYPLAQGYPVAAWQPQEIVHQRYLLHLPPNLAEGEYTLILSLAGQEGALTLGQVHIAGVARLMTPPPIEHPLGPIAVGTQAQLLGYDLEKDGEPALPLQLTLYWRSVAPFPANAVVFVHLLNEAGQIVAQQDIAPAEGSRPTMGWLSGEIIVDRHTLTPAQPLAPGRYRVAVGLYDPTTLARYELRTTSGERISDDRLLLPEFAVK